MNKLTIRDFDLKGERVFIRVDFNVPIKEGVITDDTRIREALPTINYAIEKGARIILASHLGRPKGKVDEKYSLKPVAKHLGKLLGKEVKMAGNCIGPEVFSLVQGLKDGEVLLLENLRFHKEEETNDEGFSKQLASLAELYVNDAFGAAHRAHASVAGITKFVPRAVSGFLLEKEIECLGKILLKPEKPFVAILGGAKVSDKIGVIENLMGKVDTFIIGGGMAYTFLKTEGYKIGKSLLEEDKISLANGIREKAEQKNIKLLLPIDNVVAREIKEDAQSETTSGKDIPDDYIGVDIGPKTIAAFREALKGVKTVLWNGPLGVFEIKKFSEGTFAIARAIAESGALSIVGGGDSVAAIKSLGLEKKFSHLSTGGGASLEFLEGKKLPGIECLTNK
ncbi:MAG: phosphoglycerate kinase [Candidatus Schekmanbacteria bacterium RIFCSPHIGHO2_02_FULL_38_11]|uniref:Phosphoglycerate kinase n=1 Tax=Candidatus Schekmanbacteria bacterium RIFCSPLOWO2_12_FULL_38_15 TaxID=1817883 RepID=A0A1F7SFG2_9BACT|nr:MAG: phosphoglycerate kinase [Candidatus Schekmanbacteria bacterium GWA2_38_9]OGL48541.1 MAG: phosphoglycerate kinase [Candidatus Schekmanbacteria bacterium RIFCSPLOWO2_02_FULL_38_14]OGL52520.1 MAG: phosphoglycerate kinase [Candidatus Schekmanbacteria bacterium RIFCSPLOWO2_12_FULL_38_15]OGL53816.1 MAG: phosphoglycerate kinase [Candidatus Schekmanbacteria bacterium RIFCSPHIGHO2_02_FULL_38_11]